MDNCIFCRLSAGSEEKVYEDPDFAAVLDINPAAPGHTILFTKEHYALMHQIPAPVLARMLAVAKQISHDMLRKLKVRGTSVFAANGSAAGQKAPHFIIHIIPRSGADQVNLQTTGQAGPDSETESMLRQQLSAQEAGQPRMPEPDSLDIDSLRKVVNGM